MPAGHPENVDCEELFYYFALQFTDACSKTANPIEFYYR